MRVRTPNGLSAAAALLLTAAGAGVLNPLAAAPPFSAFAQSAVFTPHFFSDRLQTAVPNEPQVNTGQSLHLSDPTDQPPPMKAADPVPLQPFVQFQLASLPKPERPPFKLAEADEKSAVRTASFSTMETPLAELRRFPGRSIALQPAAVKPAENRPFVAGQLHLVGLPQRFPASAPLVPAEIGSVQNSYNAVLVSETRLASLQQRPVEPGAPLQSAEVLPIPSPGNSAASPARALDQDRPIAALSTDIAPPAGKLPADMAGEEFAGQFPAYLPRAWGEVTYFWDAPDLCHGPLRYEEVNLERYGYSHCPVVQPALSAAHFFGATLALPYNMTARPCGECIYPLGHYRPGSPVPFRHIRPEHNPFAAAAEVGTIAGLILLIP
jgi:hypothetical protein